MKRTSQIKKFIYLDRDLNKISIPNLYKDFNSGIFYLRARHNGKLLTRSLKTNQFSVARIRVREWFRKIVQEDSDLYKTNKLFRDYYEDFIDWKKSNEVASGTLESYSISWRHHIEPFWGNVPTHEINQKKFVEFLLWHREEMETLLFNPLKLLRGVIKFIIRSGVVLPQIDIKVPKREYDLNKESKGTFIEHQEIDAILGSDIPERGKLIIDLAYHTGMRLGEICNLKIDRIKKKDGLVQIHLKPQDTKTRSSRIVPLDKRLTDRLLKQVFESSSEYVFPMRGNNNKPFTKQAMDRVWLKALNLARIDRRIRFHDLRHTCATNFANRGLNPSIACAVLGMTLKVYSGIYLKKQSLDYSAAILAISKGGTNV